MLAPRHIYVHVPFCRAACDYCGFFSTPTAPDDGVLDEYVEALAAEWVAVRTRLGMARVRSVFLGGGTPSLLGPERLERLLRAFDGVLTPHAEVTVESNPEDAESGYAAWAAERRIRVSLGAQSFSPDVRRALGRSTEADPAAAYGRLRRAGCREVGLDLIFGAPGQRLADVERDLARVAELRPEHVSWYELELVEGSPLAMRVEDQDGAAGRPEAEPRLDADERDEMYRRIVRGLGRAGFDWYEVSNFARPGHRCRHNSAVWRGEDYVGLGPGAVGTVGGVRRQNLPDLAGYLAAFGVDGRSGERRDGGPVTAAGDGHPAAPDPPHTIEHLEARTRMRERVYLASRIGAAVALDSVAPVLDPDALARLVRAGLVSEAGGKLRVTRKGRYVADEVCVRLFRDFCVEGPE